MKRSNGYIEYLCDWMSPLGEITARAMMGGHVLYCNGVVFALVADNSLFLKGDDESRSKFEARGLRPFCPFPDKPDAVMKYFAAPPEFFEDPGSMREWAALALDAGRRANIKKGPRAKKRSAART
jgi:DNA transformation protein